MLRAFVRVVLLLLWASSASAQGVVEAVLVHGNHTTPTDQVLTLAGITPGQTATAALVVEVERRLRDSGRFADVTVQTRLRTHIEQQRPYRSREGGQMRQELLLILLNIQIDIL